MEKIGFVESSYLKLASGINYYPEISQGLQNIQYGLRDSVEQRDNYIQPIAIAVVLSKSGDKILCVKKTEKSTKSDSPESGQTLLYVGGHMRKEDESRECHNFLDVLRNTLQREILEELGISLVISKEEIPFVIYTPDNEKSKKHLAIGWKVYIDEETKLRLDSYELVQKKGKSKSGTFVSFDNVTDSDIKLESWSRTILLDILSDKLTDTQRLILQCSDSNQIRLDV